MENQLEPLNSLNPTGTIHGSYSPGARASAPLGPDITTLAETLSLPPDALITIYRGVPRNTTQSINPGDFVTTNAQLAKDYAGTGSIIKRQVPASHVLDSRSEPLGEEYIYQPPTTRKLGRAGVVRAVTARTASISRGSKSATHSMSQVPDRARHT